MSPLEAAIPIQTRWYSTISRYQWKILLVAKLGWMLDAMDFMLYAIAVNELTVYFGFSDATAGILGTVALATSAVGGITFGFVADRVGRTRALMFTILIFSFASLGTATSQTLFQLLLWRALLGIGMGGEWATGAVLISETWPPAHRNKAISIMQTGWALGYLLAAVLGAIVLGAAWFGDDSWRLLFALGAVPAVLVLWVRRNVEEPAAWTQQRATPRSQGRNQFAVIFGRGMIGRTLLITLLSATVQFAYWGVFFWLPAFLSRPIADGGAGMGVVGSLGWIIPVQVGAYFGYLTFGFIADAIGRRRTFVMFMLTSAVLVPVYGQMARSPLILLLLSPVLGYVGHGYFSMFGSFIAELFPTSVRATGQGTSFSIGRLVGGLAPFVIGYLGALPGIGIGLALGVTSGFFLLAALLVFTLPDRSGQPLEA